MSAHTWVTMGCPCSVRLDDALHDLRILRKPFDAMESISTGHACGSPPNDACFSSFQNGEFRAAGISHPSCIVQRLSCFSCIIQSSYSQEQLLSAAFNECSP